MRYRCGPDARQSNGRPRRSFFANEDFRAQVDEALREALKQAEDGVLEGCRKRDALGFPSLIAEGLGRPQVLLATEARMESPVERLPTAW